MNNEYESFDTIEEARNWLEYCIKDDIENVYHPDLEGCEIYKLVETVGIDVIDEKANYKYENEEDIPEDDNESEAWPYSNDIDEIWQHKFIPVTETPKS
jgi:viroplasmin and RNaseH domain-containing protein